MDTKQKLIALDGVADNNFANSVAITRNYAIIGSKGDNSNVGSAYIFQLNENIWTQKQKLVSSDGASDDEFGSSVSISGNYVIIGAMAAIIIQVQCTYFIVMVLNGHKNKNL